MSHSVSRQLSLRTLRSLWSVALGLLAVLALTQPASAATVTLGGTDPADVASAPLDLVSGKIVYDSSAGKVTVTVQTLASNAGVVPTFVYALLGKRTGNQCVPDGSTGPVLLISMAFTAEANAHKWILNDPVSLGDVTVQQNGASIVAVAGADSKLKGLDFNCAQLQTKTETPSAEDGSPETTDVDAMNVFVGGSSVYVPAPVFTDQPDKDKDGVPDSKDKCPDVAGGGTNATQLGCLTIADKLSIRLGAKRVAIDKMVARTATVCPVKAKVKVTAGKKTIGTGVVAVSTHGSFCRVYGVVKLKKTAKSVKITVKAAGMGSISAARKR